MLELQEKKLRILELKKSRFKWLRIKRKEDMNLDKMRLENERMKLENVCLETELNAEKWVNISNNDVCDGH